MKCKIHTKNKYVDFFIQVSLLEEKISEKESQHAEILLKLQETHKNYSQLQESASMFVLNVNLLKLTVRFSVFKM